MPQIPWTAELELGLPVIDEQHAHLLRALNELDAALTLGNSPERVARALADVEAHGRLHFEYEEQLMRRHGLPTAEMHAATHQAFTDRVRALVAEAVKDPAALAKAQPALSDWLVHHILETDKRYVPLLAP